MPCRTRTAVIGGAIPLGAEVESNPKRSRTAVIAAGLGLVAIGAEGDGSGGEEDLGTLLVLVKFQFSVMPLSSSAVKATPMATLAPGALEAPARMYTKGGLEEPALEVIVRVSLSPGPLAMRLRLSVFHGSV